MPWPEQRVENAEGGGTRLRLVRDLAADDGAHDLDVLDLLDIDRVRVVGQHHVVGQLARRDRALDRFFARGPRAVAGVDRDRLARR